MAEKARIWGIRPSSKEEQERFAPLFWKEKVAAIDYVGNSGAGDLRSCTLPELKSVVRKVRAENGEKTNEGVVSKVANRLCRFANDICRDDWILSPRSKPGDVMIGLCASSYEYAPGLLDKTQFPYIIKVDWLRDISRKCLSEELQRLIEGRKQSPWCIDGKHIPELESLCKLGLEYRRVPVDLPNYLVQGVDELVGERGRSHFIVHVVLKELEKTEEIRKEKEKSGEEFHPYWETSAMVYAWVRASRDLDNERSKENWSDRSSP